MLKSFLINNIKKQSQRYLHMISHGTTNDEAKEVYLLENVQQTLKENRRFCKKWEGELKVLQEMEIPRENCCHGV